MRLAAIGDLHCRARSEGVIRELLAGVEEEADVLALAGDLTDTGLPEEMEVLVRELAGLSLPLLAVLGNHDHESDHAEQLVAMLRDAGVCVLEATVCEIDGVGFVGTKGFCGGFDRLSVQPFGERALKAFIRASIDEAVALENAAAKLDTPPKVAILHYSPVPGTLEGEARELYPFLGSSRLAGALDRQAFDLIVHGHAHHGCREARTPRGTPVHNVCRFVRARAGERPYAVFDL